MLQVQVDESKNLVIARILGGGTIDKQGLLHVGDAILEVNGVPVYTPEDLQSEISRAKESVTLKIGPRDDTVDVNSTHAAQVTNGTTIESMQKKLTVRFYFLFAVYVWFGVWKHFYLFMYL